jgi:glycosyltransferase involved in cell wall biosynthesis
VCIITYNEADNIQGVLDTVKWADDIVVVDAYSTDRTVEIARSYTERVFVRAWPGFVAQKNFATAGGTPAALCDRDASRCILHRASSVFSWPLDHAFWLVPGL